MATVKYKAGLNFSQVMDFNTLIISSQSAFHCITPDSDILQRAADSWLLLTSEEKNEYINKAEALDINELHLFIYDYLSMTGIDIVTQVRKKERVFQ